MMDRFQVKNTKATWYIVERTLDFRKPGVEVCCYISQLCGLKPKSLDL